MVVLKFASKNNDNNFIPITFAKCDTYIWAQFILHGLTDLKTARQYRQKNWSYQLLDGVVSALLSFGYSFEQEKKQTDFMDGKSLVEKLTDTHVIHLLMQHWNRSDFELNTKQQETWDTHAKGMVTPTKLTGQIGQDIS